MQLGRMVKFRAHVASLTAQLYMARTGELLNPCHLYVRKNKLKAHMKIHTLSIYGLSMVITLVIPKNEGHIPKFPQ